MRCRDTDAAVDWPGEIPCNDSIINFIGLKFIGPVKFAPVKQKNEEVSQGKLC